MVEIIAQALGDAVLTVVLLVGAVGLSAMAIELVRRAWEDTHPN